MRRPRTRRRRRGQTGSPLRFTWSSALLAREYARSPPGITHNDRASGPISGSDPGGSNHMTLAMIGSLLLAAQAAAPPAEGRPSAGPAEKRSRPSQDEPMAPPLAEDRGRPTRPDGRGLDAAAQLRLLPLELPVPDGTARVKEFDSPATGEVRTFLEKRVAHWDDADAEAKPRWDAEVVSTAEALAINDASDDRNAPSPHPQSARPDVDASEGRRRLGMAQVRLASPRARRLLRGDRRGPGRRPCPRWLRRGPVRPEGLREAPRLFPEDARPRPAPPDHAPLGLNPP